MADDLKCRLCGGKMIPVGKSTTERECSKCGSRQVDTRPRPGHLDVPLSNGAHTSRF